MLHLHVRNALCGESWAMVAMEPVWRFLHNLEGFEFAAFWIAFFTATLLAGFFLD